MFKHTNTEVSFLSEIQNYEQSILHIIPLNRLYAYARSEEFVTHQGNERHQQLWLLANT